MVTALMRALTVIPGKAGTAQLDDLPPPADQGVRLAPLAVGICGTDAEIVRGEYGWAPPSRERLVLGHECIARVAEGAAGLKTGDLVVPIVRHPDPVPCSSCAAGEWDMCRNGLYTEHGIKQIDGFCAESVRVPAEFLVPVAPALDRHAVLVEPTSVVAKAWEHIERIGNRAHWQPRRVLVTGAGPVGLLAALLGRQRGFEVMLFDRVTTGIRPKLAAAIDAGYVTGPLESHLADWPPDIVLECTGATPVIIDVLRQNAPGCVTCLVGVSSQGKPVPVDVGAMNRSLVLENDVVFGSVNANRRHYQQAAAALAAAKPEWLEALISRRVPLDRWQDALARQPDDVKVVLEIAA